MRNRNYCNTIAVSVFSALAACCLLLLLSTSPTSADIVFYTSEAAFDLAASNLVTQTFSSANIGGIGLSVISNPLNSATNNAVFAAGSILPGLTITSSASHSGQDMGVVAPNVFGNPNKAVYNNFSGDSLFLSFAPVTTAVGFGLLNPIGTSVGVTVDGPGGAALKATTASTNSAGPPLFFGAIATQGDQIGRIELLGNGSQKFAGVDRVLFSGPASPPSGVPEPGSLALIVGSSVTGSLFAMRRLLKVKS